MSQEIGQQKDMADVLQEFVSGESSSSQVNQKQLLFEIVMLMMIPMPLMDKYIVINCQGVDVTYLLSEFLLVFMFSRFYFFIRTAFNFTIYNDPYAKRLLRAYENHQSNILFSLKCHLKINPVKSIVIVAVLTCTIPAYVVRIFEIPYFRENGNGSTFDSYFNSLYFTIITLPTVGYGDVVPGTIPGKIVILMLSFWGAFTTSQIVLSLTYAFSLSQSQNQVLH